MNDAITTGLAAKIRIVGMLPDYALSIHPIPELTPVNKIAWLSSYIPIDEKIGELYKKGLLDLSDVYTEMCMRIE